MAGDEKADDDPDSPVDDRVDGYPAKRSSDRKANSQRSRRRRYRVATSKRRAKPSSSSRETDSRFEGIVKVAPRTYLIDSSLVNRAQKSPQQFISGVHAVVYKENRKPIGFKLKRISVGNVLRAIGLRNGDILTAINGHPLRSVEQALFAAAAVGSKKQFRLDIFRKNRRRTFYYRVQ
jgi:C-terminal processing protease CtpA/Prc